MGHAVELRADGGVDFRVIVAVEVRPDRGVAVEIFAAAGITEERATALDEHKRLVRGIAPRLHLRERVPGVCLIGGDQGGGVVRENHFDGESSC